MLCKHWLTFPRKGHVGLVENKTGVYFRTRKKLIKELVLQLLNIPEVEHTHMLFSGWQESSNVTDLECS